MNLLSIFWPIGRAVPHVHSWRRLTSKDDYGNWSSRHYGGYHGVDEEECRGCGVVRNMDRAEAERLDAAAAVKAAAFNLSAEGLEFWRKRSLKDDGAIMISDGGSVERLESGDQYNGHGEVLSEGLQDKWFGAEIIFKRGELVYKRKAAA